MSQKAKWPQSAGRFDRAPQHTMGMSKHPLRPRTRKERVGMPPARNNVQRFLAWHSRQLW